MISTFIHFPELSDITMYKLFSHSKSQLFNDVITPIDISLTDVTRYLKGK